jgi:hypothetical protein
MKKQLTKRELQKVATKAKRKEERKAKRIAKLLEKQKYKDWANEVKQRDNFTCLICNEYLKDGNIHNIQAHHLLAKETYPKLKLDIMNGITLCYYDHKNSAYSPHLNALAFIELLKTKRPEQYEYLVKKLKEIKDFKYFSA